MAELKMNCLTQSARILHGSRSRLPTRCTSLVRQYSVFEPDDINLPPEIPEYSVLNIRLRAYDYVILESFAKYAHNLALSLGVDANAFPVPARTATARTFKKGTTNIQSEHNVAKYERVIQAEDLPSTVAPILLDVLSQNLPEGINMTVMEPDPEEEEFRYVPDIMLLDLQGQVAELEKAREDRRK